MIDRDGDAVNLAHVATVQAQQRLSAGRDGGWYAVAFAPSGKGSALSGDMATQGEVLAWIAKHFGESFDQHADQAEALIVNA